MSATEAPERIGPYRLLRQLGEGGMGVVHLGLDEEGREVAVKVLHQHVASDLKARDRLTREVETMRRVRSPRVAEVLDADLISDTPYIVTRYAPGRTLEQTVLEDGPLPDDDVVRLARGLCEALVAIHAADVIHRDLKPANVMLVDGEPLVIDFGIAHLVNATRLTQTGMFVGTPGYLAPEIIRDTEITQAADVHALAATVFFAVSGKPPFGSGTFESVCYNILEGKAQIDLAPPWLHGWLRLALATDSASRPTAGSLLRLSRALDPSVTALQEVARDGGTRVLDASALNGHGSVDGTRVMDDAVTPAVPYTPSGVREDDSYSDLLPPVNYVEPERPRREPRQSRQSPARAVPPSPPGFPPGQGHPPPYQPAPYPPPFPDQRVAGYPPAHSGHVAGPQGVPPGHTAPPGPRIMPPAPTGPAAQARPYAPEQERPRYRTRHPVLAGLLLTILVALACLLPVTVSLFAIVAALCLRVGHYLLGDLAERRSVRGSSGADPILAVLGTPWALIKSVFATLVQVPLAAMFGMCVWGALVYIGKMGTDPAAAYAAGAFVAGLFVLPGGGAPRKAVARTLTGAIRSPGAGMVVALVVGTVAFFAVMTALSADPSWAPWRPPSVAIDDIVGSLKAKGEDTVVNLIGGLIGDITKRIGQAVLPF
ncbi:serine/threonine protein kinase [Microtetraspora sp. AC03309]|uniref:serine/threonine-protein kinase n=1 Tax=Microtetraspora sp. AC03309 TaxID=2779376 RepID=UPI001E4A91A0|nr:serine/threonine-protein kinase [Microtetraspora sp. AC03309]MCC5577768.1 serine/threonine protein kinase [Microtetraspora sp. AC03309]